jgi:hypothetical protein
MRPPEYITWTHVDKMNPEGKECTQLTASYKRDLLIDYAAKHGLKTFVETGTCGGDTIEHLLPHFDRLYSIELDQTLFEMGVKRFYGNAKVMLIEGDSAVELPKLLPLIEEPALYWLDAHNSGPPTAGEDNPLMAELDAITKQKKQGVVLVDDMDFGKERILADGILRIVL